MALAVLKDQPTAEDRVIELINAAMERNGGELSEATREVAEHLGSLRNQLWHESGWKMLSYIWRINVHEERNKILQPGPRVIKAGALNEPASILSQPVRVGGFWTTIGELDKDNCGLVAHDYMKRSDEMKMRGEFFAAVAKRLKGDNRVRDAYTDADLQAILDSLRP